MAPSPSGLGRGERAPDCVLPLQDGTPTRFYARAGGTPAVLLFCPVDQTPQLLHFATTLSHLAAIPGAMFAVLHGCPDAVLQAPFPVFSDTQGTVTAAYRLGQIVAATCFVLSPNLQVLTTLPLIAPLEIHTQAPVLLIPHVLTLDLCHALIHVWETRGHAGTEVEYSSQSSPKHPLHQCGNKSTVFHIAAPWITSQSSATIAALCYPPNIISQPDF